MASNRLLTCWAVLACGALSGCHLVDRLPPPHAPDVKPIREQRKSEVVQEFEQQRNGAQYQAALSFWERGDKETGKEMLEQILRRSPNHRDARIALAEFAIESNDLPAARRQAAEIESRFPNDVGALETLAAVHELAGETDQAETYLRRASEEDTKSLQPVVLAQPESLAAAATKTPANKATAQPVKHDAPEKLATKPNAPARLPAEPQPTKPAPMSQHASTTLLAAEICLAVGRPAEAGELVQSVLSQNLDDAEAQKLAQRVRAESRSTPPKSRPHSIINSTVREKPEPRSLQPVPTQLPQKLAEEPRKLADVDEPPPHDTLAQQATDDSQSSDAATAPSRAFPQTDALASSAPANGGKRQTASNEWLRKGVVALEVEATESARRLFERALESASDEKEASEVAVATLRHGQTEWTIQLAQAGLKRYPQSASLYRILGTAQYRLNDFEASQVALRQALSLDKTSALSYFLLGCTLSKLGDREGADWHYRQARLRDARFASK